MLNIDKYAYASALKLKDPMEKLIFTLLTIGVCLWANRIPISIAIILIMSWVTVRIGRTPFHIFAGLMIIPTSFLFVGVLTIIFGIADNQSSFLFCISIFGMYIGVGKMGIAAAVGLLFKALGSASCLYYLSLTTPIVDILSALRRLRCPKLFLELMGLIYRFIFVLLETAETMIIAQNSRLGYSSLKTGFRSMSALASTLFIRSYKSSEDLYIALEARGYDGELSVLEEHYERSLKGYVMPLILNLMLIAAALYLKGNAGGVLL